MKVGKAVTYYDADGAAHAATVAAVWGSGPSMFKILDLVVPDLGSEVLRNCRHERDKEPDGGYWTLDPLPVVAKEEPAPEPEAKDDTVLSLRQRLFGAGDQAPAA